MLRILKANIYGIIEVAIPDTDYATFATEEILAGEAQDSVNDAHVSAGKASDSAFVALTAAGVATDAANAAVLSKDAASAAESAADVADTAASASLFGIRVLKAIDFNIATETTSNAGKVSYYSGLANRYSKQATEAVKAAGLRVINKQIPGIPGAEGAAGIVTLLIQANINTNGGKIGNISQSPGSDYDAISLRLFWDLFHDNVEIVWQ